MQKIDPSKPRGKGEAKVNKSPPDGKDHGAGSSIPSLISGKINGEVNNVSETNKDNNEQPKFPTIEKYIEEEVHPEVTP